MSDIKERIFQLRQDEEKALREDSIERVIRLKRTRLNLELEELNEIANDTNQEKEKLFNPQKLSDIIPVKMDIVGKNYIPLVKSAYNIISGRGGSGKSAVALKSMLMWLNDNKDKTALAYFTEDAKEEIEKRASIICENSNIDKSIIKRIFFVTLDNDDRRKWINKIRDEYLIEDEYIKEIVGFCKENQTEYIILDPLKRFHRLDENSNNDMDVLVRDCFTRIAVDTQSALVVLHHSAKSEGGSRGAGTITDSARLACHLSKFVIKDEDGKAIENPKKKGLIKLEFLKDNLGIEKICNIRGEENSISNPLSRDSRFEGMVEVEFNNNQIEYKSLENDMENVMEGIGL